MIFDPFGDFETRGYLRNSHGEKNMQVVKSLEHQIFFKNSTDVADWLSHENRLDYDTFLKTHEKIFSDLYPWAGQDRLSLTPSRAVRKGDIIFASPEEIHTVFVQSIHQKEPEKVLSGIALAHPFLDGNGRVIVMFFSEFMRRQKKLIRWDLVDKNEYLINLGEAIQGNLKNLSDLLNKHTVTFPVQNPETDRVSRILRAINWGEGASRSYEPSPTLLEKIFSKKPSKI